MSGQDAGQRAFRAIQLASGEWTVDFLGHAFIADPEPNQKDAEWLVAELQKDYDREIGQARAEERERCAQIVERGTWLFQEEAIIHADLVAATRADIAAALRRTSDGATGRTQ